MVLEIVVPGQRAAMNPEPRDSGFDPELVGGALRGPVGIASE
jgi:hypothetical protein